MSAIVLQPFVSYDEGSIPPPFEYDTDKSYIEPDNEQIISMRDSLVLSYYGDDMWDLTPYTSRESASLNFTSIISKTLKKEAKRLVYLTMTHSTGKSRSMPSGSTVSLKYHGFIKPLAEYIQLLPIEEGEKCFNYMLSHTKCLREMVIPLSKSKINSISPIISILTLLKEHSKEYSGFEYVTNKRTEQALRVIDKRHRKSLKQTILIPTSIYAAAGKMRWEHIDAIDPYSKNLEAFIYDYAACKGFGAASASSVTIEERNGFVQWNAAIKKHSLEPLFKRYNVIGLHDFFEFIYKLQGTCRHIIHQYTGMRLNECLSLSRDCWKDKSLTMPSRIHGIEQKIHGVPTHQVWITHDIIKRVIDLLRHIGVPMANRANHKLKNPPLMIKISKLKNRKIGDNHYKAIYPMDKIKEFAFNDLKSITLTQEHIDEMSLVDGRDWNEHAWVKKGAIWHFTTHQYRRSLAIYALGSGLVSLHAVKEQFGHLISAMTSYYGNGHKSSRKLDGKTDEKDHISNYMRSIKKDMMFYSYRKNVLLSPVPLYGSSGIFLEKHIVAKTPEEREVIMRKSDKYKNDFKKNGQFYEETAVGGCTNNNCEKRLIPDFFLLFYCKSCDHSIHRLEKIARLSEKVRLATIEYAKIHPNSVDHRTMLKMHDEINHFADILKRKEQKEIINECRD